MDRDEAQRERARRTREHPDRATHGWVAHARGGDGEWALVKVPRLPGSIIDPLTAAGDAKPEPSRGDDPRPNYWRNVGGPWHL